MFTNLAIERGPHFVPIQRSQFEARSNVHQAALKWPWVAIGDWPAHEHKFLGA